MKITSILPYFGGKRTMAPRIVQELGPHSYYFEGCAGSLAVLLAKEPASHETACDLHGGMTNLAWVVQREDLAVDLFNRLQRVMYSDGVYRISKGWLKRYDEIYDSNPPLNPDPDIEWAYHYFLASWMGRNGVAGTERVNYQIATRWTPGGGSGPLRFANAVDSIPAWCERLKNVHILRRDLFEVLPSMDDCAGLAIYCDPPYLKEGSKYLHPFLEADHARLAEQLRRFKRARVVVSYYADPRLAEMYPGWEAIDCTRQKNLHTQNKRGGCGAKDAPEVLLLNGPSLAPTVPAGMLFG